MQTSKYRRFWSFIIDSLAYYLIMYIMIIVDFVWISRYDAVANNLTMYEEKFNTIMHRPLFIIIFIFFILLYEVVIPFMFNGQTLSKRLLKIQVNPHHFGSLLVRALVKTFIVNPNGAISFAILGFVMPSSVSMLSNGFSLLLIISAILLFAKDWTLQDFLSRTKVELIGEEERK